MHSTPRIKFNMSLFPSFLNIFVLFFFSVTFFFCLIIMSLHSKLFTFLHNSNLQTISTYNATAPTHMQSFKKYTVYYLLCLKYSSKI